MYLSVVIPSYNETENLERGVLQEVYDYLSKQTYTWEVIVSDDGSPDTMARNLAQKFCVEHKGFIFLQNEHAGKPFAVWSGVQKAKGEIMLFTDMDQSTPICEIEKLLPFYQKGFDVVIGSRGLERRNFPFVRRLASAVFREFRRSFLLRDIVDTQAGFKSFRTDVAREVFPLLQAIRTGAGNVVGWNVTSFDVELLVASQKRGYKIIEVPVSWEDKDVAMGKQRGGGKFISESVRMVKEVYRVKRNEMRGLYNK